MSGEHPKYLYESWLLPYKPVVPNTVAPTDDNHVYQYYNEKNRQRDKINRRIVSKEELETDKYWWDSNGNPYLKSSDYSYSVPKDESVPSISKSSPNTNPEAKYDLNPNIASSSNLKSAITAPGAIISMDTNSALKIDVTHKANANITPAASFIHHDVAPASKLMSAISNPRAIPSTDTNLALNTDATPKASPNITSAASAIANPNIASSSNLTSATSSSVTISLMDTNSATPTLIADPTPNPTQPSPITPAASSISATESNLTAGAESFASTTSTTSDVAAFSANISPAPKANTTSMAVSPTTTILATKLEDLANTSVSGISTSSANILPASKANPASITPKSRPLSRRRSIPGLVIDSDLMSKLSPKSASSISPVLTSTATIPAPIISAANSVTEDTSAPMTDSSISSVSAVSSNVTSKIAVNIFPTVEAAASVAILPTSQGPAASDALSSITEPQDLNAPTLTTYLASISKPLSSMHIGSKAVPAKKAVAAASFISASLSAHKPDSNDTTLTSTAEPVPTVSPAYILSAAKTVPTSATTGDIPDPSTKPAGSESIDCTISDLIADISSKVASTSSDILIPPSTKVALSDSLATSITAITTSKGRPILSGTTASTVNDTPIPSAKTAGDSPATSFISAIHASIGPKFISAHSIEPDDSSPDPSEKSCKTGPKFQPRLTNYQRKLGKLFETPISSSSISKAEKMMLKMGWSGGALGKQGGGIIEPITPNLEYVYDPRQAGVPCYVTQEEFSRYTGFWWQPKSDDDVFRIVYEEVDESDVKIFSFPSSQNSSGEVEEFRLVVKTF
ncbi:mucin-5AC-like [Ostrinia furnacalis]|uniref:mucin-5AC-like n=1 Tax=Ostrinia furnacalis TaxID=93504 RepID=UPI00103951F4|nr:mucin-5AC-like [Ostrinia furnacalis]